MITGSRARSICWFLVAVSAVVYAPFAAQTVWVILHPDGYSLTAELMKNTVSNEYAYGPSSGALTQPPVYHNRFQFPMMVHVVVGSLLMLLGPLQFSKKLRIKHHVLHRYIGFSYLAMVALSLMGSAPFLLFAKSDEVFSGNAFRITLLLAWLGTFATAIMAYVAIAMRDVISHLRLLSINFALLLSAPLLRYEWIALGNISPVRTHPEVNQAIIVHIAAVLLVGALVAQRSIDRRSNVPGMDINNPPPTARRAIYCSGGAAAFVLGVIAGNGDPMEKYIALSLIVSFAIASITFVMAAQKARRDRAELAGYEWRMALIGTALGAVLTLAVYLLLSRFMPNSQSFLFAAAFSWPVTLFTTNAWTIFRLHMAWRRLRSKTSSSTPEDRQKVST